MDQGGGLEAVALRFIFHVPASHQEQFGIGVLRQPDQGDFVTAAPGFQQKCDFVRTRVDGLTPSPWSFKNYTRSMAGFGPPLPPAPVEGEPVAN